MKNSEISIRFRSEVLASSPQSTLPCNLSGVWLEVLSQQATSLLEGPPEARTTEIVAALLHIVSAKHAPDEVSLDEAELFSYFQQYRIELALEEVRRYSAMAPSAASIETIFTERDVQLSRREMQPSS